MPRPLENPRIPGNSTILHGFGENVELRAGVLPRFCSVATQGVTPRLTARNAPGPPIRAAEPLFLPPAVNSCTV